MKVYMILTMGFVRGTHNALSEAKIIALYAQRGQLVRKFPSSYVMKTIHEYSYTEHVTIRRSDKNSAHINQ